MKRKLLIASALVCAVLVFVIACQSEAAKAQKLGGSHLLGGGLNDSGIPVDESGAPSMAFVTPVQNPLTGQPVVGCYPAGFYGDFGTCQISSTFICGEHKDNAVAQLTPAQCAAIFNLIKTAAQSKLDGGTFQ
jgi:hypothetical protein